MVESKQYKVALVLYTQGLDYDDRIRKEILSIQGLFNNVHFKIFAFTPKDNREEEGVTSYGVPYKQLYLKSREKYPSGSHTLAKSWDLYKTIKKETKDFDAIWCADPETFLCVLLLHGKPLLWDLHELPESFMHNSLKRALFKIAVKNTDVMVHANQPRLKYLVSSGLISDVSKQFVLRNYPQFDEIDNEYDETYESFVNWLGDSECVYLQGINAEMRADVESIGAVLAVPDLKAVIIGNVSDTRRAIIEKTFGKDQLNKRCFFTGQIKQLKTPQYIRKCKLSLVFYKNVKPNNWYCEPNRLFQNLINGNPVVVGENPPMKEIIDKYGVGVCAKTDGSNVEEITKAILSLKENYECVQTKVEECKNNWLWESQNSIIHNIVIKWLNN